MGKTKRGKGTKLVALADACGLPICVCATSASAHEVTLVGEVLAAGFLEERPERLIGERAYDSDPLDAGLRRARRGGHRDDRPASEKQEEAQDPGRAQAQALQETLEDRASLLAWLHNFRRVVVRYERRVQNYLGFAKLGCIVILLRRF